MAGVSFRRWLSMRSWLISVSCLVGALLFTPANDARAEVVSAAPEAFEIRASVDVDAGAADAWRALLRIERWWNDEHTFSGDAANLRLQPVAGGCWCERWDRGQSVEHARVVLVMINGNTRSIRLNGALGPLQALGANGVLTFTVTPHDEHSRISLTYRVDGSSNMQLETLAPVVSEVLDAQLVGLTRALAAQH